MRSVFIYICAFILGLVAAAKLFSVFGTSPILGEQDPVLGIGYRQLLTFVGVIELAAGAYLFLGKRILLKLLWIDWFAFSFLTYRMLHLNVKGQVCPCLGTITGNLPISPGMIELFLRGIVLFFAIGGGVCTVQYIRAARNRTLAAEPVGL